MTVLPPTILIADDSRSARNLIAQVLQRRNYHILQACNGKEAFQMFQDHDPDVVLMDANMPVVDGFRTCNQIKHHPKGMETKVIMITGQGDDASVEKAFASGAEEFVTKPIHWAVLERRIDLLIEQRKNKIALQETLSRIQTIFNTATDALIVANDQGIIESVNRAAAQTFGFLEWEMPGKNVSTMVQSAHSWISKTPPANPHEKNLSNKVMEGIGTRKDGSSFPLELSISLVSLGNRIIHTSFIRDITERKRAEAIIVHQANHDVLTGLPNRSMFMRTLAEVLREAKKGQSEIALIFIDLDRFKWVNDTLGHGAGDTLLIHSSRRILAQLEKEDTLARLGGDEFTVILRSCCGKKRIMDKAQEILAALNESFMLEEKQIFISGSLGVAVFPADGEDLDALLKRSDEAMYKSKKSGRNACHFASGESFIRPKNY